MPTEDKPAEDDGLADWAEALMEQKSADTPADGPAPGGVLSEDASRSFASSSGGGGGMHRSTTSTVCWISLCCCR